MESACWCPVRTIGFPSSLEKVITVLAEHVAGEMASVVCSASRKVKPVAVFAADMGTKTIQIDDGVYKMIREKREDETFSEAIERHVGGGSLLDLYGAGDKKDVRGDR